MLFCVDLRIPVSDNSRQPPSYVDASAPDFRDLQKEIDP